MVEDEPFDDIMDVAMSGIDSGSSTASAATMNPMALTVSSAPMPALTMAAEGR